MASCGAQNSNSNAAENYYETLPDPRNDTGTGVGNNYVGLETMHRMSQNQVFLNPIQPSPSVRVKKSSTLNGDLELEARRIRLIMTIGLGAIIFMLFLQVILITTAKQCQLNEVQELLETLLERAKLPRAVG